MNLNFRTALMNSIAIEAEGSAPVDASPVDASPVDASNSNRDQDTGYSSDHLAKLRKQHLEAAREAARIKKAEEDEAVERELDAAIARSRREHDAMEAAANANAKDDQDALIVEAIRGGGEVEVIDLAGSSDEEKKKPSSRGSSDDGDKKLSAKKAKTAKKASPKRKRRQKRPIRALDANEEVIEIDMPTDQPCAPFAAAAASSTASNAPRAPRGDEDFARRLQEEEDAALAARINPHGEVLDKLFSSKSSKSSSGPHGNVIDALFSGNASAKGTFNIYRIISSCISYRYFTTLTLFIAVSSNASIRSKSRNICCC